MVANKSLETQFNKVCAHSSSLRTEQASEIAMTPALLIIALYTNFV